MRNILRRCVLGLQHEKINMQSYHTWQQDTLQMIVDEDTEYYV